VVGFLRSVLLSRGLARVGCWIFFGTGSGIEVMHMIRKVQMKTRNGTHPSAAEQFYSMVM
jgi:hypothetical protein